MFENIRLAFHGIWGHKLRSLLTMLGIIIGIASIIAIVSTIQGTNEQIKQNLIGAGNNSVVVQLYEGDYAIDVTYYTLPESITVIPEEIRQDIENLGEVAAASLYNSRSAYDNIYYGSNTLSGGSLIGIDQYYFDVYGYVIKRGRGFVEDDWTQNRKVVILDETSASSLFPDEDPLDKTIEVLGEPFTVIGISAQSSQFTPTINSLEDYYTYMNQSSGNVYVTSSAWPIIYRFDEPQAVVVRAANTDSMTGAGQKTADILNDYMALGTESPITYKSQDLLEQAKELQELASSTQSQLIWIASISLLVGGIGVMNIMLVSVTERIREIGLKKALGARKSLILWQFLTEAAVLTSIGGIIGVGGGVALATIVSRVSGAPMAINVPISALAVVFSMLIGVIFGLLPAVKAANLNPIDALRHQ